MKHLYIEWGEGTVRVSDESPNQDDLALIDAADLDVIRVQPSGAVEKAVVSGTEAEDDDDEGTTYDVKWVAVDPLER
jgi:hypothetical protein